MIKFAVILIAVVVIGAFGIFAMPLLDAAAATETGVSSPSGINETVGTMAEDIGAGSTSLIGATVVVLLALSALALFAGLVKL